MIYLEDGSFLSTTIKDWITYHQNSLVYLKYKGLSMIKNPFDLIVYDEIIWDVRPTIIIEIGSDHGGFALWLADHAKMLLSDSGINTEVITIDLCDKASLNLKTVSAISCIVGDCNSTEVLSKIKSGISDKDTVLIIEDSSHYYDHTINVLGNYKDFVTVGSYFIVEDGICDVLNFGPTPGPMRVVEKWIINNPNYMIDRSREKYIITYNPKGFLKRINK
jgi:cephalosporin hydroxylase